MMAVHDFQEYAIKSQLSHLSQCCSVVKNLNVAFYGHKPTSPEHGSENLPVVGAVHGKVYD